MIIDAIGVLRSAYRNRNIHNSLPVFCFWSYIRQSFTNNASLTIRIMVLGWKIYQFKAVLDYLYFYPHIMLTSYVTFHPVPGWEKIIITSSIYVIISRINNALPANLLKSYGLQNARKRRNKSSIEHHIDRFY